MRRVLPVRPVLGLLNNVVRRGPRRAVFLRQEDPFRIQARPLQSTAVWRGGKEEDGSDASPSGEHEHEHAVISTFDLFSIGIGPSSSHTVGPMRAGNIFINHLREASLLEKVHKIRIWLYGSLALTGEGHLTPPALLLGLEGANVETVDTNYVPARFEQIKSEGKLFLGRALPLGSGQEIAFDYQRDLRWEMAQRLPLHSNGMRITVFDNEGHMLATNELYSIGGGFVVNGALSTAATAAAESRRMAGETASGSDDGRHPIDLTENIYYKGVRNSSSGDDRISGVQITPPPDHADGSLAGLPAPGGALEAQAPLPDDSPEGGQSHPRYAFRDATSLLNLCRQHNLTIAQVVFENEKSLGLTEDEIFEKIFRIWDVMDNSILEGVQAPLDSMLPGSLKLVRRAPKLYKRLTRGLYPNTVQSVERDSLISGAARSDSSPAALSGPANVGMTVQQDQSTQVQRRRGRQIQHVQGSLLHPIAPSPGRRTTFPAMDHLSVYAIAVNETNAAGGRVVTAPTNGAAGIVPAVLKYLVEFVSDDAERDVPSFLLTAAAIGMLYKRGATISAAEGGCMAEVGVACSMAAAAFAACMGASPEVIEQAAEIGIEHNLGLTCDPIAGLVQAPCIERNALGAIKAISSANLALSSAGTQKVRLDDAIRAMRLTAEGMRNEFKETSLSGLATSVQLPIPVSLSDC